MVKHERYFVESPMGEAQAVPYAVSVVLGHRTEGTGIGHLHRCRFRGTRTKTAFGEAADWFNEVANDPDAPSRDELRYLPVVIECRFITGQLLVCKRLAVRTGWGCESLFNAIVRPWRCATEHGWQLTEGIASIYSALEGYEEGGCPELYESVCLHSQWKSFECFELPSLRFRKFSKGDPFLFEEFDAGIDFMFSAPPERPDYFWSLGALEYSKGHT